jgi:hypothetical protein
VVTLLYLNERFIVDAGGHPVEVVLPNQSYRQLLALLAEAGPATAAEMPLAAWREQFRLALARAGYTSREEIVELTRQVKRVIANERWPPA